MGRMQCSFDKKNAMFVVILIKLGQFDLRISWITVQYLGLNGKPRNLNGF